MKKIELTFLFILVMGCLFYFGCKSSTELFTLTVVKGEGIGGFPEAGTYNYEQNSTVFYNYYTDGAVANPVLTLNDQNAALNGAITMNRHYTLAVSCDALDYNGEWLLTGNWEIINNYMPDCQDPEDSADKTITITHSTYTLTLNIPHELPWYPEGLELSGDIFDGNCFDVVLRKNWMTRNTAFGGNNITYELEHRMTAQFISSTEFQGHMEINLYQTTPPMPTGRACIYKASIRGIKKIN